MLSLVSLPEFGLSGGNGREGVARNAKRWFLGLKRISNQTSDEIDQETDWTAMTGMFNLGDVLELVNNGFHDGTLAQEQFVHGGQQAIFHVFAEFGDELNTELVEQQS